MTPAVHERAVSELFTPVNLLTGFLGSGKTTLLQRLLADPALADTAVLINEFGEVGLDHHLLERIDDTMVLLQSGCVCCTIRGELSDSLRDLHVRRAQGAIPPFRRVVVESTGLADPFPILSTIHADTVLRHHYRVGNVITTIDAVNASAQLRTHAESVRQIAVADRLVLTKTDLADPGSLMAEIGAINPGAPIWRAADGPLDAAALLSHDMFGLAERSEAARQWIVHETSTPAHAHRHDRNRHGTIRAFALTFDAPLDWTVFGIWLTMLLNRHGAAVLRVKGILDVTGSDAPVAVHGVQHLVHKPVHMAAWPDADRRSRLVFIVDGLDPSAVERSLRAFMGVPASSGLQAAE